MARTHANADLKNSEDDSMFDVPDATTKAAQGKIKSYVERFERLAEAKADIAEDEKELGKEAKGEGFDVKQLKRVVKHRKQDRKKRQEDDAIFELYLEACGEDL